MYLFSSLFWMQLSQDITVGVQEVPLPVIHS